MKKLIVCLWLVLLAFSSNLGPEATLIIKDNSLPTELTQKAFHLQATTFSEQPFSARHSLIRVVKANPISGCSDLELPAFEDEQAFISKPIYYLVQGREGECTYSRKVHFARKALARGIIIIDSTKGTNNLNSRLNRNNFHVYLMPEAEGDAILNALANTNVFYAQLDLVSPNANKAEVWISSLNLMSYDVLEWWSQVLLQVPVLSTKLDWKPRFALTNCHLSNTCGEYVSSCACGGDFCSPEVHGRTSNVLVREDIRQMLLFNDNPEIYLFYAMRFKSACLTSYIETNYAEDCSAQILEGFEVNSASLSQRIDSFLTTCGEDNQGLALYQQLTLDRKMSASIGHYPTIYINHEEIAIASQKDLKDAVCKKLNLEQEEGCREVATVNEVFSSVISWVFWVIMVVALIGAGVLVVVYFKNRLRREMNKQLKMQVSTAVEHYFSLSETSQAPK